MKALSLQDIIRKTVVETIRRTRGGRHRRKRTTPMSHDQTREFWSGAARQMYNATTERMNQIDARLEQLEARAVPNELYTQANRAYLGVLEHAERLQQIEGRLKTLDRQAQLLDVRLNVAGIR